MGWTSSENWKSTRDAFNDTTKSLEKTYTVLDAYLTMDEDEAYWALKNNQTSMHTILCGIFEKRYTTKGKEIFIKVMNEAEGPVCCQCPLSFFSLVPITPHKTAVAWRHRVKEFHSRQKMREEFL